MEGLIDTLDIGTLNEIHLERKRFDYSLTADTVRNWHSILLSSRDLTTTKGAILETMLWVKLHTSTPWLNKMVCTVRPVGEIYVPDGSTKWLDIRECPMDILDALKEIVDTLRWYQPLHVFFGTSTTNWQWFLLRDEPDRAEGMRASGMLPCNETITKCIETGNVALIRVLFEHGRVEYYNYTVTVNDVLVMLNNHLLTPKVMVEVLDCLHAYHRLPKNTHRLARLIRPGGVTVCDKCGEE